MNSKSPLQSLARQSASLRLTRHPACVLLSESGFAPCKTTGLLQGPWWCLLSVGLGGSAVCHPSTKIQTAVGSPAQPLAFHPPFSSIRWTVSVHEGVGHTDREPEGLGWGGCRNPLLGDSVMFQEMAVHSQYMSKSTTVEPTSHNYHASGTANSKSTDPSRTMALPVIRSNATYCLATATALAGPGGSQHETSRAPP